MSDLHLKLPPVKNIADAKHQFVELYGSTVVMNTYLKIAVLCLSVVCVALTFLNLKTYQVFRYPKPIVIRINELGRAEATENASLDYHPQESEVKYFLIQFVQQHYGRMRATIQENYSRSLYFLDGRLADALIEANKKSKSIESFLAGEGEEIDVHVKNVSLEDLRNPPYRATLDYEKVYFASGHIETKREKFVGNFVFTFKSPVTNAMIPVNPLGFAITYFREDQAFQ